MRRETHVFRRYWSIKSERKSWEKLGKQYEEKEEADEEQALASMRRMLA
jgi:hypothetical protein